MKVAHLLEEPKDKYFDRLVKTLNIQKLGSGAFGTVFQHPVYKNVAVKILNSQLDPRFAKYIEWCTKHQDNPWVPKIVGIERMKMPDTRGYDEQEQMFVFLEKLTKASESDVASAVKKFVSAVPVKDRTQGIVDAQRTGDFRKLKQQDWKTIAKYATGDIQTMAARFAQIVDKHLDIHYKNVMMRGNQLVFTDPTS